MIIVVNVILSTNIDTPIPCWKAHSYGILHNPPCVVCSDFTQDNSIDAAYKGLGRKEIYMNSKQPIPVVIADDEASIRNGLKSAIDSMDLNLEVLGAAKNGLEAWELILALKPLIVVTDIRMPGLDGLDLMKRCRENHLETAFIILSGYDDFTYAQTAIRYGARAYVLKPFKLQDLETELMSIKNEIEERQRTSLPDTRDQESLRELSKKLFLNQLIHNEFHHPADLESGILQSGLPLTDSPCQILLFSLQPQKEAAVVPVPCLCLLKNIIEEHTKALYGLVWENSSSQMSALVFPGYGKEPSVLEASKRVLAHWKQAGNTGLSVAMGTLEPDLIHAGRSYGMAVTALSYQLYDAKKEIFDQSMICGQAPAISTSSIDTSPLLEAIWKNDRLAIKSYCQGYFHSLLYVSMPPPSFIRGMSIFLVTDIQNSLRKQAEQRLNLPLIPPYAKINELTTFDQIVDWSVALFLKYGEAFASYKVSGRDQVIFKAKEFIRQNMNRKIQAEDVALVVNLSPSYFAIYFKSKTGVNFRDYVLNVKMEHAKFLLNTEDANISQVSYAVGYDDYRSFYRAFKKHTGLTPSEYQAGTGKEKENHEKDG